MRNFLWEGNDESKLSHLVNWRVVSLAYEKGGSGIDNWKHINKAFIIKMAFDICV